MAKWYQQTSVIYIHEDPEGVHNLDNDNNVRRNSWRYGIYQKAETKEAELDQLYNVLSRKKFK